MIMSLNTTNNRLKDLMQISTDVYIEFKAQSPETKLRATKVENRMSMSKNLLDVKVLSTTNEKKLVHAFTV